LPGRHDERGVALVIALALVALVGAWAAASLGEDDIVIRRAENMQSLALARLAAESALALGERAVRDDAAGVDALDDAWAAPVAALPVDEGRVTGRVVDENRFFNLDDLVDDRGVARPDVVARARRLFRALELDPALVDALVDWMDTDDLPFGAGGAEDAAYADKPWRVKNAPLDDLREVLLVKGFDARALGRLRGAATAFPHAGLSAVNVNTAPRAVLLALAGDATEAEVDAMLVRRKDAPWRSVSEWAASRPWSAWAQTLPPGVVDVRSRWFRVEAEARFGRARRGVWMRLERDKGQVRVLARGPLETWP